ncbi:hypothetical protein [Pseudomonas sp. B392_1p]|uniref:hypothetical protein n=1 Tax=Pseudomonas sp. B392_1p TaxID=3457507 RepID=UPI003FD30AD7
MAAFKTTEKMRKARETALAQLKEMSLEELFKRGTEHKDSVVSEFLVAHRQEYPIQDLSSLTMQEEFTVSNTSLQQADYRSGRRFAAYHLFYAAEAVSCVLQATAVDGRNSYYCQAA